MDDQELVENYLNGDSGAFEELMRRYQGLVFHTIRGMLLDPENARDLTQETFIRASSQLRRLRDPARLRPWLLRIAVNLTLDRLRRQKDECSYDDAWMTPDRDFEERAVVRDLAVQIKAEVARLAPRQRTILSLHLFREMRLVEIAELLEMKPATVRSNLHFGLQNLRQRLKEHQIECQ